MPVTLKLTVCVAGVSSGVTVAVVALVSDTSGVAAGVVESELDCEEQPSANSIKNAAKYFSFISPLSY